MSQVADSKKAIKRTVIILVVVMSTILLLFFNKITTPRYLSDIELKVNGFVLFDKNAPPISAPKAWIEKYPQQDMWVAIIANEKDKALFEAVYIDLKSSVQKKLRLADKDSVDFLSSRRGLNTFNRVSGNDSNKAPNHTSHIIISDERIALLKPSGELLGYFVPPYEKNKLTLTLSSAVTHR